MKPVTDYSKIPKGIIIFISGVPGAGKTTISYELLKRHNEFRIIEETDLIREVLRGYNDFLKAEFGDKVDFVYENINIANHTKPLSFDEAKEQCRYMKSSLEQIVARQQRKGISTIVNGVHIIPEVLNGLADNQNIIYINLFVSNEDAIRERISHRDPTSFMRDYISFFFQVNRELYLSTERLAAKFPHIFNIDVSHLSVDDTIARIICCIQTLFGSK